MCVCVGLRDAGRGSSAVRTPPFCYLPLTPGSVLANRRWRHMRDEWKTGYHLQELIYQCWSAARVGPACQAETRTRNRHQQLTSSALPPSPSLPPQPPHHTPPHPSQICTCSRRHVRPRPAGVCVARVIGDVIENIVGPKCTSLAWCPLLVLPSTICFYSLATHWMNGKGGCECRFHYRQ